MLDGSDVKLIVTGVRLLGAVIGTAEFRVEYIKSVVKYRTLELMKLSDVAKAEPPSAFASQWHSQEMKLPHDSF